MEEFFYDMQNFFITLKSKLENHRSNLFWQGIEFRVILEMGVWRPVYPDRPEMEIFLISVSQVARITAPILISLKGISYTYLQTQSK
jgi:hypothetical protein